MAEQGNSVKWVFTLNNWNEEDLELVKAWDVKYLIVGKEVGEQGTPHLQGYAVFNKRMRFSAVKKLEARCHWEVAKGNHDQNYVYCSKQGNFFEVGERPLEKGAGEKRRWQEAKTAAIEGRLDDIPADIYLRYYRTCKEIKKDHMTKPDDCELCTGVWYYGDPGVGKSHMAREKFPGAYLKMQNKWWDGYQGEEHVILDDFDSKELGHHLKIWADKYSFLAETKGGAICIRPKSIVVTSNYKPSELWEGQMLAAVERRFKVTHVLPWNAVRSGTTP